MTTRLTEPSSSVGIRSRQSPCRTGLPFLIRTGRDRCRLLLDLLEPLSDPPLANLSGSLEDRLLVAQVEVAQGLAAR